MSAPIQHGGGLAAAAALGRSRIRNELGCRLGLFGRNGVSLFDIAF